MIAGSWWLLIVWRTISKDAEEMLSWSDNEVCNCIEREFRLLAATKGVFNLGPNVADGCLLP